MKILYLAENIPFPIYKDGGTLMNYHLMKHLKKTHEIHFMSFTASDDVPEFFLSELCNEHILGGDKPMISKFSQIIAAIKLLPPIYQKKSVIFANRLAKLIEKNDYDMIFVDTIYMDVYTSDIVHQNKVISLHDSLALLYESFSQESSGLLKRIYHKFCCKIYKNKELRILQSYKRVFFVSQKDLHYLTNSTKSLSSNLYVIANGVNQNMIDRDSHNTISENLIVFSGIMDYKPNIDAVIYFVKNIFPKILMDLPDTKFIIVGKNPVKKILELNSSNIEVTGWVENIAEYIDKATVYVSPLVTGAGLKNKILEAMALRIPIVATSISIDGLMLEDNKHILIADNSESFANSVVLLLEDKRKRNLLIDKSYDLIKKNYTWVKILEKYDEKLF